MQEPGTLYITFPKSVEPVLSLGGSILGAFTNLAFSIKILFNERTGILLSNDFVSIISQVVSVIIAAPSTTFLNLLTTSSKYFLS